MEPPPQKKKTKVRRRKAKQPTGVAPPICVEDADPTNFGSYTLGNPLGRGAYGRVFQGLDISTGRIVAIKTISLNRFPDAEKGIQSEIELMSNLDNEHIVKYIGSHRTEDYLYIVMEYAEGGSLQHIQKKFQNFDEHLAAQYLYQVLLGLKYLHEQSIIHRDIKAANILLSNNLAKLADFGISVRLSDDANQAFELAGSPYWTAPEVINSEPVTEKSDIWSLGITAIEIYTGEPPYFELPAMAAMFKIVQNSEPPLPPGITPEFKDFLTQCLTKNVGFRKSTEQLLNHKWIRMHVFGAGPNKQSDRLNAFMEKEIDDNPFTFNLVSIRPAPKTDGLNIPFMNPPSSFNVENEERPRRASIKALEDSDEELKTLRRKKDPNGLGAFAEDYDDFSIGIGKMDSNAKAPISHKKPSGGLSAFAEDSDDDFAPPLNLDQQSKKTPPAKKTPKGLASFAESSDDEAPALTSKKSAGGLATIAEESDEELLSPKKPSLPLPAKKPLGGLSAFAEDSDEEAPVSKKPSLPLQLGKKPAGGLSAFAEDSDEEVQPSKKPPLQLPGKKSSAGLSAFAEDSDEDMPPPKKSLPSKKPVGGLSAFAEDSDEEVQPPKKPSLPLPAKKPTGGLSAFAEDSDDDMPASNKPSLAPPAKSLVGALPSFAEKASQKPPLQLPSKTSQAGGLGAFAEDSDDEVSPIQKPSLSPKSLQLADKPPLLPKPISPEGKKPGLSLLPPSGASLKISAPLPIQQKQMPVASLDDLDFISEEDARMQKENDLRQHYLVNLQRSLDQLLTSTDFTVITNCLKITKESINLPPDIANRYLAVPFVAIVQKSIPESLTMTLPVINDILKAQPKLQRSICILGVLRTLMNYTINSERIINTETQFSAASILRTLCQSAIDPIKPKKKPIRMFIAAGGLPKIAEAMKSNPHEEKPELTEVLIDMIYIVFKFDSGAQKLSFAHVFAQSKIISLLGHRFAVLPIDHPSLEKLCRIFEIFSLSDQSVKVRMAEPEFINNIIKKIRYTVPRSPQILEDQFEIIMACLDNISRDQKVVRLLWKTHLPEELVKYFGPGSTETQMTPALSLGFSSLFHLAHTLSSDDVNKITSVIPFLMSLIRKESPMRNLAIILTLNFINQHATQTKMRHRLTCNNVPDMLYSLLGTYENKIKILSSFLIWAQTSPLHIESFLMSKSTGFAEMICGILDNSSVDAKYQVSTHIIGICDACPNLATLLSQGALPQKIVDILFNEDLSESPECRLSFSSLIVVFYQAHPKPKVMLVMHRLDKLAKRLLQDPSNSVIVAAGQLMMAVATNYLL